MPLALSLRDPRSSRRTGRSTCRTPTYPSRPTETVTPIDKLALQDGLAERVARGEKDETAR